MKKKGFTLLELLAVIVVLAAIFIIAVPIIAAVINKAKLGSLKDSAYGILESAELYYAQYKPSSNIRFDIENGNVTSDDTTNILKYRGSVKRGTVIIDNKGATTICLTDGTNSVYKNYNDKNVIVVEKDTCYIPENRVVVYLEGAGATRTELTNQELTDQLAALQDKVDRLENEIYPVGSIYISTTDDTVTKVQERLGGTWEVYGTGRTLVGVDASQTEFDEVNKIGGEKTHALSVNEMPSHSHIVFRRSDSTGQDDYLGGSNANYGLTYATASSGTTYSSANAGGSQAHNNLQPYITVYMYRRVS